MADKSLLLCFDNFEHLVDAAADLAELLGACPNLRCSSRAGSRCV